MIFIVLFLVAISIVLYLTSKARQDVDASFWRQFFEAVSMKVVDYYYVQTPTKIVALFLRGLFGMYSVFAFSYPTVKAFCNSSDNEGFWEIIISWDEVCKKTTCLFVIAAAVVTILFLILHRHEAKTTKAIRDMSNLMGKANYKLDNIISDSLEKAKMSGLCPSSIIENDQPYITYIPTLHSERKEVIAALAIKLKEKHSVLLYGGVKEGKTVTAALLCKIQGCYKILWIDFAQENEINLDTVLSLQSKDDQLLFVLDNIKYNSDTLYEKLCSLILKNKRDNWYFLIVCYEKLSEVLFDTDVLPDEFAVPPLTEEEVGEMIPKEKRDVYQGFIHTLFEGQPILTNMACSYLQEHGWEISEQEIGKLFTFPKGTPLEKKVKRMSQDMMDNEAYALVNRLLLLDRHFSAEECRELAAVNPVIVNPIKKLSSLCGTWVTEENGVYKLSPLLRNTIGLDLLPEERRDCCQLIARKLINKKGGITPNDALHVLNMLTMARNSEEAAGFYVSLLYKMDEEGWLCHDASSLWRAVWIDSDLPDWMTLESKAVIRMTQILILLMKNHVESQFVVDDMERLIDRMPNNCEMKAASVRLFIGYLLLNNKTDKLAKYKELTVSLPEVPTLSELNDEKFIFVALDNVKTKEELLAWAKNYKDAGSPEIDLLADGVIMKVNTLCNAAEEKVVLMEQLTIEAYEKGYELVTTVACARWLDELSAIKDVDGARTIWEKYELLSNTKLGSLLLNYSYGLCLCYNGFKDEGLVFVEKACENNDIEIASMVKLNASATLTELRGKAGDVIGAAEVMRKLVENPDFDRCYTDFEKGAAYGTLSYAYWMAGEKVKSISEMLKVEQIIWDYREKQDDDFKNLSMRFSVLVLSLSSEELNRPMDENDASAEYCLFMKPSKHLLDGYKTERNFTILYGVYQLTELVLKDDSVSLRIIDHMLALQKTDASQLASYLSVLMQAFPLLVNNDREKTLEYVVLSALAGAQVAEEKGPVNYDGFVLVNAIAALVMKRTILLAEDKDVDEDVIFDLAEKSVRLLSKHNKTDMVVAQMKKSEPDYSAITDLHEWGLVATYHFEDITPAMGLTAMYVVVKTVLETSGFESSKRFTDRFVKSLAYLMVKEHANRFNLEIKDFERYFGRIGNKHGMEYLKSVMQGILFYLKSEPILDKDIASFIDL